MEFSVAEARAALLKRGVSSKAAGQLAELVPEPCSEDGFWGALALYDAKLGQAAPGEVGPGLLVHMIEVDGGHPGYGNAGADGDASAASLPEGVGDSERLTAIWAALTEQMRIRLPASAHIWLNMLEPLGVHEAVLHLGAPPGKARWIRRRFGEVIHRLALDVDEGLERVEIVAHEKVTTS